MRQIKKSLLLFVVSFAMTTSFLPSASVAQDAKPKLSQKQLFNQYLNSPGYKSFLVKVFNLFEHPVMKADCPKLKLISGNQHITLKPPVFVKSKDGQYAINAGTWIARGQLDRCGKKVFRRVALQAIQGKNNLKPTPLLPGDFRGNLKLEFDARRIVLPGIAAKGGCKDNKKPIVLDIKAGNKGSTKGWWEVWTALTCKKIIKAAVRYVTDPKGTTITARVGKEGETPSWEK